ncbi:DUF2878 domain-containing protein [Engelhardtia mirabilis]|uniref:DUF2878 domain-containing protein n=1 Tax=Engelhardtia mirabilis TaxID=2528011 RepID=A0A518BR64_9BACT|nr:hypothetical protein Pla133_45850 [Planctomycetes bacterium Pla133]QDV03791.1 hypothetical protein Pla86_45830 [Planctomycetes bacterium Pla86]
MATFGKLANFLAFQLGWWACVLGAAQERPLLGPAVVAALIVVHLAFTRRRGELGLVLFAALLGLVLDGGLAAGGLLRFDATDAPFVGPLPLWMVALWANFAPSLGHALGWMRRRYIVGLLFGALGGPTTYFAGVRLGALQFGDDMAASLIAITVVWAVAMPLLLLATERLLPEAVSSDGNDGPPPNGVRPEAT